MSDWLLEANGTWTNSARWSGGSVPNGAGAVANFAFTGNTGNTALVDIPGTVTLGALNVSIAGTSSLAIIGSPAGSNLLVFNAGVGGVAQIGITNSSATGSFRIVGDDLAMHLASDTNVTVNNATGHAEFSAPISGSKTLTKSGAGTLELAPTGGANTLSGAIRIQAGTLQAADDSALGTAQVNLLNNAVFRSSGTIDNAIGTEAGTAGNAGSGQIVAASGQTLTLTGTIQHLSQGVLSFGNAGNAGTIVASASSILENATDSSFQIGGGTLRMGNSYSAQHLLAHPGTGSTTIGSGAVLDTGGFLTYASNLNLAGGTVRTSTGNLQFWVLDRSNVVASHSGTIQGTAFGDFAVFETETSFNLTGITFSNWTSGTDLISLRGNNSDNNLTGSTLIDTINGLGGSDVIQGQGGADVINGGDGDDFIFLIDENDGASVDGGTGTDSLRVFSGTVTLNSISGFEGVVVNSNSTLTLTHTQFSGGISLLSTVAGTGTINITMNGAAGTTQTLLAKGMAVQSGANITFTITGGDSNDIIKCSTGAQNIVSTGNGAVNTVQGGGLGDTISGGTGIDKIAGNGGVDVLSGGGGADVFKFRSVNDAGVGAQADIILDFLAGTDRLNFGRIDADPNTAGDQAFQFMGTGAFAGNGTASIRWVDTGADLRVEVDVDGDFIADMHIMLMGAGNQTLAVTDFVL